MINVHRVRLFIGTLACVTVGMTLGVAVLLSTKASSSDLNAALLGDMRAAGVDVATVNFKAAENRVEVVVKEGSGDAWAITVVPKELGYFKQSGYLSEDMLDITIVDDQGRVTYQSFDDPIEPALRPTAKTVAPGLLDGALQELGAIVGKQGIDIVSLTASGGAQGIVVEGRVTLTGVAESERDNQIKSVVIDLLPQLRDYSEKIAALDVDLYRLTMENTAGVPVVDYVVNPKARSVNAWSPGIEPVWSLSKPVSPSTPGLSTGP